MIRTLVIFILDFRGVAASYRWAMASLEPIDELRIPAADPAAIRERAFRLFMGFFGVIIRSITVIANKVAP